MGTDKVVVKSVIPAFVATPANKDKTSNVSDELVLNEKVQKLKGPKVIGKITLPFQKKKKRN
jgi:hypothetical protein